MLNEKQFDFLKDIMAAIADVQQDNDESETAPRPKGRYAIIKGKFLNKLNCLVEVIQAKCFLISDLERNQRKMMEKQRKKHRK